MRIGLGCVTLGGASGPSGREAKRLVHAAIDAGVTIFDTADAYGHGASERTLGRALAGRRDEVEIATKVGYGFRPRSAAEQRARITLAPIVRRLRATPVPDDLPGPGASTYEIQDFSSSHLRDALEASLRRLGTDHVDVYQLHGPPGVLPEALATLRGFVDAGLVRRVGIGAEHLESAGDWLTASPAGAPPGGIDVLQLPFGPLDPGAATEVLPGAGARGVEIWARGVFGGGVLAADLAGSPLSALDRAKVARLRSVTDELGLDLFELALCFVRSFPSVSVTMLGMSSERHLRRNLEVLRTAPPLPPETVRRICNLAADDDSASGAT